MTSSHFASLEGFATLFRSSQAIAAPAAHVGVKAGVLDGILNAGPFVQALVLLMIGLSITSWAIIFTKYRQYNSLGEANTKFIDKFWRATSLESLFEKINDDSSSNLARVFKSAFLELQRLADSALGGAGEGADASAQMKLHGIDNLERVAKALKILPYILLLPRGD